MFKTIVLTIHLLLLTQIMGSCKKDTAEVWETTHPVKEFKQYDVPFVNVPEIEDITMYEVNLRAFSASGDLKGVEKGLDHIKGLGINVIWLMPIHPTAIEKGVGSPYAVRDYMGIHPDFGDLADLRSLVKEAHKRDMAIILDWVGNHTSFDNKWTKNSAWYVKDDNGNIINPPNTGWTDVAELNFDSQEMRQEMIKALNYWVLEANVDGYRCDYAAGIPDDFWKQAIDNLRSIPNRELILFAEAERKELTAAGFDLVFGWPFYNSLKELYAGNTSSGKLFTDNLAEYAGLTPGSQVVRWVTNHDQNAWEDIPQHYFGGSNDGAISAFVLATYTGGVPLIYTGQEVAHTDKLGFFEGVTTKINWSQNPSVLAAYTSLMNYYHNSKALKEQSLENFSSSNVVSFKKKKDNEEVFVIVNVTGSSVEYTLPQELAGNTWC